MPKRVEKPYRADYAKSDRASCKKCGGKIPYRALRMGILVHKSPMIPNWYHYDCFWKRARLVSHADVDGFSRLRQDDKEKIKKAIVADSAATDSGDQEGGVNAEKNANSFAVEYAKSNRSTCKSCRQKIEKDQIRISKIMVNTEKPQLGKIDNWYHPACFVSRRADLGFLATFSASQLLGFGLLNDEDKETLKKELPAIKNDGKRKGDETDASVISKKKPKKGKGKEQSKQEKPLKA